jgi:hypothetical protein
VRTPAPAGRTASGGPAAERYAGYYERLRERVGDQRERAGPGPSVRSLALMTLLDEGLPAWLDAIAGALPATSTALARAEAGDAGRSGPGVGCPTPDASQGPTTLVATDRQYALAVLLANLVLSRHRPPLAGSGRLDHGGARC